MKRVLIVFLPVIMLFIFPARANSMETYTEYCKKSEECTEYVRNFCSHSLKMKAVIICMQKTVIMRRDYARLYQNSRKKEWKGLGVMDLYEPYGNILVCADILSELCEKYGDLYCVLMCYNEGEYSGEVERYEKGNYSRYAVRVVERAHELERINNK